MLCDILTVRPAPVRSPAVKRPMPAGNINATSIDVKRMRTTSAVMPAVAPASTVLESSSVPDLTKHPCAVINLYRPGVVYQVVGESGPAHSKIFTTELIVDEQVGKIKCLRSMFFCSVHVILAFCCSFVHLNNQHMTSDSSNCALNCGSIRSRKSGKFSSHITSII